MNLNFGVYYRLRREFTNAIGGGPCPSRSQYHILIGHQGYSEQTVEVWRQVHHDFWYGTAFDFGITAMTLEQLHALYSVDEHTADTKPHSLQTAR